MKRLLPFLAAFSATFLVAHFLVLALLPGIIMSAARTRMLDSGISLHDWAMSPRVTPQTQTIVRPAPDLAYTVCLIDLSSGPVELVVPSWPAYGSLSVFENDTDNVYAGSLDTRAQGSGPVRRVILARPGQPVPSEYDAETVRVRSNEALALIRRLAPDQASYEAAAALAQESRCTPL